MKRRAEDNDNEKVKRFLKLPMANELNCVMLMIIKSWQLTTSQTCRLRVTSQVFSAMQGSRNPGSGIRDHRYLGHDLTQERHGRQGEKETAHAVNNSSLPGVQFVSVDDYMRLTDIIYMCISRCCPLNRTSLHGKRDLLLPHGQGQNGEWFR